MTTVKQLYSLQEVDLDLDGVNGQIADVERELEGRLSLDKIEASLEEAKGNLQEIQSTHRQLQLETESQRERAGNLDTQLYGGALENPRDLEALQLEATNVRHTLEQMDVRLLELSLQAEDARNRIANQEQQLTETQSAWETRQAELWEQLEELTDRQEALSKDRSKLAAGVEPMELARYEGLRRSKGGQAISRVVRGLCQACRMSLPSQHMQQVRSGRQTVLCNSCGRILLPG